MVLSDLKAKDECEIVDIKLQGKMLKRILEMGLVPKTKISVCSVAPKKRTILISVRGYLLAMSEDICNQIEVKKVGG